VRRKVELESSGSKETTLWYWSGGLSDKVVADAVTQFAADHAQTVGHRRRFQAEADPAGRRQVRPDITGSQG